MGYETSEFPFESKAEISDDGAFVGYLAVFGNKDLTNDIIMPGAFAATIKRNASPLPILWQHDTSQPIGVFRSMEEDARGLKVEGLLTLGVRQADEARLLMQAGALRGMSIGYVVKRDEWDHEKRARKLLEVDLHEGSLVTFPANPKARVTRVKEQILEAKSQGDLERALREAGLNPSAAQYLASRHKFDNQHGAATLAEGLSSLRRAIQTAIN